jgi:hypothetical protein
MAFSIKNITTRLSTIFKLIEKATMYFICIPTYVLNFEALPKSSSLLRQSSRTTCMFL